MTYKLPYMGRWWVWNDEEQAKLLAQGGQQADGIRELMDAYAAFLGNRIQFFLPHSGQKPFLNDNEHMLKCLIGGNQKGKTAALIADLVLDAIENNPKWMCFTHHGLVPRKWDGPKRILLATYELSHLFRNVYPAILNWIPIPYLGEYSPLWKPKNRSRSSKVKHPDWSSGFPYLPLTNGTVIDMYTYRQPPETFESTPYDRVKLEEQPPEWVFESTYRGGMTRQGFQMSISYTPTKVKRRETETGKGSWLSRLRAGTYPRPIPAAFYVIKQDEVPAAIQPKSRKDLDYQILVKGPEDAKDLRAVRIGRARYYGEEESPEGLVFDNVDDNIHFIDRFPLRPNWTRYRVIDPGRQVPTAALCLAMTEWGDGILYDEYYEAGRGNEADAEGIILMCGNTRVNIHQPLKFGSVTFDRWEEQQRIPFRMTVMDPRTHGSPTEFSGLTVSMMYAINGLKSIPGVADNKVKTLPIVRSWFDIKKGRKHILVEMGIREKFEIPGIGELDGAPLLYAFRDLRFLRTELYDYTNLEGKDKPDPRKADHLMSCLCYLLPMYPKYVPPVEKIDPDAMRPAPVRAADRFTAWR